MTVRPLTPADVPRWAALRAALWPGEQPDVLEREGRTALADEPPLEVFVAEVEGRVVGFLELSLRSVAEGCASSPVPYVEGWYVAEAYRRRGAGRALMEAAEAWSRARGYREVGSDTEAVNALSRRAHAALGFAEVATIVVFRKPL